MGCRLKSVPAKYAKGRENKAIPFANFRVFSGKIKAGEDRIEPRPPNFFSIAYDGLTTTNAISRAKSTSDSIRASAMIISV